MLRAKHPLSPFLPKTVMIVKATRASLSVSRAQRFYFPFPQIREWEKKKKSSGHPLAAVRNTDVPPCTSVMLPHTALNKFKTWLPSSSALPRDSWVTPQKQPATLHPAPY